MAEDTLTPEQAEKDVQEKVKATLAKAGQTPEDVTPKEEKGALDYLLGATAALEFDLPVQLMTPDGKKELIVHFKQMDGDTFRKLEEENRSGEGPFSRLDVAAYNRAIVQAATVYLTDESGKKIVPSSPEFIGEHPEGQRGAWKTRFKFSSGVFDGISSEVQRVSGYDGDLVGTAQRSVVDAVGGS